jgi:hypothetical protein
MIDLTAEILEQAVKNILGSYGDVFTPIDGAELPDNFDGYLVQVRHTANTVMTNDGKTPVVSVYALEVTRRVFAEQVQARRVDSGATLAVNLANVQNVIINILSTIDPSLTLNVINVSLSNEDIATTESETTIFTSSFDLTVQPLIVEEL